MDRRIAVYEDVEEESEDEMPADSIDGSRNGKINDTRSTSDEGKMAR